jgi:hypothetical protein
MISLVGRVEVLRFEDRLDRRYAKAVREIAKEVGTQIKGRKLDEITRSTAIKLATGNYPHVVIKYNLF